MRHRMHIGTIVSDAMLKVKLMSGGFIGVIEEWFISRLEPGEVFTLAGRNLELVMIKDMTVMVRKSSAKKSGWSAALLVLAIVPLRAPKNLHGQFSQRASTQFTINQTCSATARVPAHS